jgi:hypothetical protein
MSSAFARAVPETTNRGAEVGRTNRRAEHPARRSGRTLPPSRVPVRPGAARRPVASGLRVGSYGSRYEQEADRLADQVADDAGSVAPSRLAGDEAHAGFAPASVATALSGAGGPLDPALRGEMERRFDHDFSGVRIHSGSEAERSARDLGARAYTVGTDIVVGASGLLPGTRSGRRLIAHELTHVVQQSRAAGPGVLV